MRRENCTAMFDVRQSIYIFFFFPLQKIIRCENCETETRLPSCDGANGGFNIVLQSAEDGNQTGDDEN